MMAAVKFNSYYCTRSRSQLLVRHLNVAVLLQGDPTLFSKYIRRVLYCPWRGLHNRHPGGHTVLYSRFSCHESVVGPLIRCVALNRATTTKSGRKELTLENVPLQVMYTTTTIQTYLLRCECVLSFHLFWPLRDLLAP